MNLYEFNTRNIYVDFGSVPSYSYQSTTFTATAVLLMVSVLPGGSGLVHLYIIHKIYILWDFQPGKTWRKLQNVLLSNGILNLCTRPRIFQQILCTVFYQKNGDIMCVSHRLGGPRFLLYSRKFNVCWMLLIYRHYTWKVLLLPILQNQESGVPSANMS